ncbi:MAG: hypothetical protein JNL21_28300 [Myxococcales bacterium]|nr:hypothetical protein [Myxococcales bacterium]
MARLPSRHRAPLRATGALLAVSVVSAAALAQAWTPLPTASDPLLRMPGTQPSDGRTIASPTTCQVCHAAYDPAIEPHYLWSGSMMAQSARDPLFWAATTVAMQDSIWAIGRPNAGDLCIRCHAPEGWVEGRSEPPNGSFLMNTDFDGVHCATCHTMVDPFAEATYAGLTEGDDWVGFWDESGQSVTPSDDAAALTLQQDRVDTQTIDFFSGKPFYGAATFAPVSPGYTEAASGQYVISGDPAFRASFADADAPHAARYSRLHKSRHFCATCHDVSNPVLANLAFAGTPPGDGTTELPTETQPAHAYGHVERTFSEFMLSDYAVGAGAPGEGPYDPSVFETSRPGNLVATCQDCHMSDATGKACNLPQGVLRPTDSVEHPKSGVSRHDLTGANAWIPRILASTRIGSPNYDPVNEQLLAQGPGVLTLNLTAGLGLDADALLDGAARAEATLAQGAAVEALDYDAATGALSFRIKNQTGHKLPSGYPEGRRMFVNVVVYDAGTIARQINPYDYLADTLRGLPASEAQSSPPLLPTEEHRDDLVYEVTSQSALTGEAHTFHMALATSRTKDNRVPPKGFRIDEAAARMAEPVWGGAPSPAYFSAAEYAGGYDAVSLTVPAGADGVAVRLFYQTTSREYVEFLRDEINGAATTLASPSPSGEANAYIIQTDPFFSALSAWGDTIWALWDHNRALPGAAPILVGEASWGTVLGPCAGPGSDGAPCDDGDLCTTADACMAGACMGVALSCGAIDSCHEDGACEAATGLCTEPVKPDGSPCEGGTCVGGTCEPSTTSSTGSGAGGAGAGGSPPGTGGATQGGGGAGGQDVPPGEADGCGCALPARGSGKAALFGALLVGLTLRRRRGARG